MPADARALSHGMLAIILSRTSLRSLQDRTEQQNSRRAHTPSRWALVDGDGVDSSEPLERLVEYSQLLVPCDAVVVRLHRPDEMR